jgi:hypothetical protein
MMPGTSAPDIPPALDEARAGAAVCYQELPDVAPTWVVLEDTDRPSGEFEEISATSALAVELTGKKVGETAVIARGHFQDRLARIVQIIPKYVRRLQDSMAEMQVRFGAASSIESVRIESSPSGDGLSGLESILAAVEKRAAAVTGIREIYKNSPVPLHMYGASFGTNAYVALCDLALTAGEQVTCSSGRADERNAALQALQTAKALVVDITALATLRLIGLTKVLNSKRYRFVVPERTWVTLHEMRSEARVFSTTGGHLRYEHGRHVMSEESAAEKEERNRKDEEFIHLIEATTDIRSGLGLASLEPAKREALENAFGPYGAESIVLASDPEYVLWTDDLVQAQVSAHEYGVRRVWTQVVLGDLADAGLIAADEYHDASARLVGMEFVATQFDAYTLIATARLSEWSFIGPPADRIIKTLADPSADLQGLLRIYAEFVVRLYREPIAQETKCSVSREFFGVFARRPGGMPALKNIRRLSSRIFGLNAIGQKQFDECFDLWIRFEDTGIVVST